MNKRGLKCNERAKAIRVSEVKQQEQRKIFKITFVGAAKWIQIGYIKLINTLLDVTCQMAGRKIFVSTYILLILVGKREKNYFIVLLS